MNQIRLFFVLLLLAVPSRHAFAFDATRFEAAIADEVARAQRAERAAGMSVGAVNARGASWLKSYGTRDRKTRAPMRNATPYQVGDFSKVLTVMAVLKLASAGRLNLDAPVALYLPTFAPSSRFENLPAIRVRDLLTHHSGLPGATWHGMFHAEGVPQDGVVNADQLYLAQPTRQIYAYSNVGFEVAGLVVAAVSGMPYTQYVESEIFAPLGLKESGYELPADAAHGHRKAEQLPRLLARDAAALGAFMSAADLLSLMAALLDEKVLAAKLNISPDFRAQMFAPQNADVALDLDNKTGLAWQLTNTGRHRVARVARMNIGVPGFRGLVLFAPDERFAALVLANSSGSGESISDLARHVFDEQIREEKGLEPPDFSEEVPAEVPWPEQAKPALMAPHYATALGLVSFSSEGAGRFTMEFLGFNLRATQRSDGWYQLRYRLLGFVPLSFGIFNKVLVAPAQLGNQQVLLAYFQGGRFLFGQALNASAPDSATKALLGRYRLLNPDGLTAQAKVSTVELTERNGMLLATYRIPTGLISFDASIPLQPLGEGRFVVPGLGSNMGDVLRLTPGEKPGFVFSGYRFARE